MPCVSVNASSSALSAEEPHCVCPFSLEGPLGDSHLGLSPQSSGQRLGTAFARGSVFPLGTDSPELPSPPAHRSGARAAMLLWVEGRPSCALQTRTQGGHRVGPRGAWPEELAAGVRCSLQLAVGQRLEASPLPGFSACHFLTSESRCGPPLTLYFRLHTQSKYHFFSVV